MKILIDGDPRLCSMETTGQELHNPHTGDEFRLAPSGA
jgi:hypothetical protein